MPYHKVLRPFATFEAGAIVDTSAWRPGNVRGLVGGRYLEACLYVGSRAPEANAPSPPPATPRKRGV